MIRNCQAEINEKYCLNKYKMELTEMEHKNFGIHTKRVEEEQTGD